MQRTLRNVTNLVSIRTSFFKKWHFKWMSFVRGQGDASVGHSWCASILITILTSR